MRIDRCGAKHNEGWTTLADKKPFVHWDPKSRTINLMARKASGGNPHGTYNYRIALSLGEFMGIMGKLFDESLPRDV